jgi:hypothetical protein
MCDKGRGFYLVKHGERRMLIKPFERKELHVWGGIMRLKLFVKMIRKSLFRK